MSRYSRGQSSDLVFPIVILVGATVWTHRTETVHLAYAAVGIVNCLLLVKLSWMAFRHRRFAWLRNVDTMDGLDFEQYVASLLRANGFHRVSLTERYDYGVDIIAEKEGIRWGIQAKRHSGLVKADAVRQVVTGLRVYGCDQAMVITNSGYGTVARRLADVNDCVLVDHMGLKRLAKQRSIL